MYSIFDLDGTLIDSSHRKLTKPDGSLDLNHWVENNTPEKIAKDQPLPLIALYERHKALGRKVIACTARVLGDADYDWFFEHGLMFDAVISRPEGLHTPDAELKNIQLRMYADSIGVSWSHFCDSALMFDDNRAVISTMTANGLRVCDAVELNHALAKVS
jgi:FMN phosphatase YigB (HAD superfamily)